VICPCKRFGEESYRRFVPPTQLGYRDYGDYRGRKHTKIERKIRVKKEKLKS